MGDQHISFCTAKVLPPTLLIVLQSLAPLLSKFLFSSSSSSSSSHSSPPLLDRHHGRSRILQRRQRSSTHTPLQNDYHISVSKPASPPPILLMPLSCRSSCLLLPRAGPQVFRSRSHRRPLPRQSHAQTKSSTFYNHFPYLVLQLAYATPISHALPDQSPVSSFSCLLFLVEVESGFGFVLVSCLASVPLRCLEVKSVQLHVTGLHAHRCNRHALGSCASHNPGREHHRSRDEDECFTTL
jgi:hypothetical protein